MYNYLGEVCIFILSVVLLFNTITSFSLKERKHVYFFLCVISVLLSSLTNVFSILRISNFNPEKIRSSTVITSTYFFFLGIIPLFFCIYCYDFVSPYKRHKKIFYPMVFLPFALYIIVLVLNFKTNLLFEYDSAKGYVRGRLKNITYIETVIYAIYVLGAVFINRKLLSVRIKTVFFIYPFLAVLISSIQFVSTFYVMTGTSSFATLLLVYLSIQSDLLEYDLQTGLLTEKQLARYIKRNPRGFLTVISIENYNFLEGNLSSYTFNLLMLKFTSSMCSYFARQTYSLAANKFAILTDEMKQSQTNLQKLFVEFDQIDIDGGTTHHLDLVAATVEMPVNAENYEKASEIINNLLLRARGKKGLKFICCDQDYMKELKRKDEIYKILNRELKVDSSQLQIYFQPIYSLSENRFVHAEALSRLMGTELGNISPGEFVAVAESRGLIERLGNVVFEKICAFIANNKDAVDAVSVNFSVFQMTNPCVVDYVLDTIRKFGIQPCNIIMEITESIFIDDFDTIRSHMIRLSAAGVKFYLDDFGTGYSNFANVINLPFSTIKIDRTFVLSMENNKELANLFKSLVHTFNESGLKILVEGVETEAQDTMVKQMDIDFIQGFLYSRPVCENDFLNIINGDCRK